MTRWPSRLPILVLLFTFATSSATAQPAGLQPGDSYHLIFATSGVQGLSSDTSLPPSNVGFFGGLDQADWIATFHAFNAGLPETADWDFLNPIYQTVLSTTDSPALERLEIAGPLFRTDGVLVAEGLEDLFDGGILAPVNVDEFGGVIVGSDDVWTGTEASGATSSSTCAELVSNSSVIDGRVGTINSTLAAWTSASDRSCNLTARLYGISPALTVPLTADFDGDLDVDGVDFLLLQQNGADAEDLENWVREFGTDLNADAVLAVPEPGGFLLALVAIVFGAGRGRFWNR